MKSIVAVCICFLSFCVHSQEISGLLRNEKNDVIEGAYILNSRSKAHTHSDQEGAFLLSNTIAGDTLLIGAMGFEKGTFIIDKKARSSNQVYRLTEAPFQLSEVVIRPKADALQVLADVNLETTPVGSAQDLLQKVPGLIIGQHAGGGKAEQLFLRGFDIDHGTDIAIQVDGMPVNMVSHAHGQGYADLHFLIPETVQKINFGKGPYAAAQGNFATAGHVDFQTKDLLDNSRIQFEYGDFTFRRSLGLFNLIDSPKNKMYMASELVQSDGPFESPQNFSRLNLFAKYTAHLNDTDILKGTVSHFTSNWDASGQIPQRAVDQGLITRFGAIDATEGGTTSRTNLNLAYRKKLDEKTYFKSNTYLSKYEFTLHSNFTFFLEDPENGDQILQKEARTLFGLTTQVHQNHLWGSQRLHLEMGAGFRNDAIDNNELSNTINRTNRLSTIQLGDVRENNLFSYLNADFTSGDWTISPALRLDHFSFGYTDVLAPTYSNKTVEKTRLSPKLNFLFQPTNDLQFFLKSGIGFHANDSRVSVARNAETVLPKAYGMDIGTLYKPSANLFVNAAAWYLFLEQEFVYVGDAGIVEPSGASERFGFDFGLRYQVNKWLFFDTDFTYSHARSKESDAGNDYIPLAPDFTLAGGLGVQNLGKLSGGIRYRFLDDRPANESNTIIADGYTLFDLHLNYQMNKNIAFGFSIENIFDVAWKETQFATTSRLQNEVAPVEEIHFTPGTPFFIKGRLRYTF